MIFPNGFKPRRPRSPFSNRLSRASSLYLLACLAAAGAVNIVLWGSASRPAVGQSDGSTRFVADGLTFVVPPGVGVRYYEEPLLKNRQSVIFEVSDALLGIRLYQLHTRHHDGPFLITLRPEEEQYGVLSESDWRLHRLTPHVEGAWDVYEEPSGYNLYVNKVGGEPGYYSCQRRPPNLPFPDEVPGLCEVDQPWPVGNPSRTTLIFLFTTNDQDKIVGLNEKVLAFMNGVLAVK